MPPVAMTMDFALKVTAPCRPIAERTRDALAVVDKPRDRTFHEHVNALLHTAVLQRSNQLEAGAVTYVA